jgi:hypothetical protein
MKLNRNYSAALLSGAVLLAACAPDSIPVEPSVDLTASAAASAPYGVDADEVRMAVGGTHQLTASNLANSRYVPERSISWSSGDNSIATVTSDGLVTAVGAGTTIVAATRGIHRVETVIIVGCGVTPLAVGTIAAELTEGDCEYAPGRLADYYSVSTVPAQVLEFSVNGLAGTVGFGEATAVPGSGAFYGATGAVNRLRVISNGGPLHAFFAGATGVSGSYTITRSAPAEPFQCGSVHVVLPGASFGAELTTANACPVTVQFSPVPEAIGKPLLRHGFNILLTELKPYTITLTGLTDTFDPALAVFGGNNFVTVEAPGDLPSPGTRTLTFTPPAAGYYFVEVSGGRFIGNLENWVIQTGSYNISISQ